jgi:hypothetical protein
MMDILHEDLHAFCEQRKSNSPNISRAENVLDCGLDDRVTGARFPERAEIFVFFNGKSLPGSKTAGS